MSTAVSDNPLEQFQWTPQPDAASLVAELVEKFAAGNSFYAMLRDRLLSEAGVRVIDIVDDITVPASQEMKTKLAEAGFVASEEHTNSDTFQQPDGIFPTITLSSRATAPAVSIKVEYLADFLATWEIESDSIEGMAVSPLRRVLLKGAGSADLYIVERHGWRDSKAPKWSNDQTALVLKHREILRRRKRDFATDEQGFDHARQLLEAAIDDIGVDYTCDLFFAAEREFWMRRNHAARLQYARQERFGIGWANHDHHTYRSSRDNFTRLVAIWELLGFKLRERFHAGLHAGWGAQVMEQPVTGIITFNDVDLTPEELFNDFAHEPLGKLPKLGTVGLWCGLHGDSFLQAGMHHLEAMFAFDSLRKQLEDESVKVMKPFTNFPYLMQAFTEGERWRINGERLERLVAAGSITQAQAEQFRDQGAIGSHLENLERNDGFKGFNQSGVSEIIAATDPRKQSQQRDEFYRSKNHA